VRRVPSVNDTCILDTVWPEDLKPVDVPFKGRTRTVLRRNGFFDNPHMFDSLTEFEIACWWNAGPVTIDDIRTTGNEAIRRHYESVDVRHRIDSDLAAVGLEPWASHLWQRDPRFAEFVPKGDVTVRDIATSDTATDRRALWNRLDALRAAVAVQGALSLWEAVSEYVEAVSGQHGQRLNVLLAVAGLNGSDPITGVEAGSFLGVSHQRVYQLVDQLHRARDRARPPAGIWMPQIDTADQDGWLEGVSPNARTPTQSFFGRSGG